MKTAHLARYKAVGLKISYFRKLRGLTQEQLAEKVEISSVYLGHIEAPNVDKAMSLDVLFDIADALDIEPYKLLAFDEELIW